MPFGPSVPVSSRRQDVVDAFTSIAKNPSKLEKIAKDLPFGLSLRDAVIKEASAIVRADICNDKRLPPDKKIDLIRALITDLVEPFHSQEIEMSVRR